MSGTTETRSKHKIRKESFLMNTKELDGIINWSDSGGRGRVYLELWTVIKMRCLYTGKYNIMVIAKLGTSMALEHKEL